MKMSVDPTRQQFDYFKSLPRDAPILMLNMIRYREKAAYPTGHPLHNKDISGKEAYKLYQKSAAETLSALDSKITISSKQCAVVTGPHAPEYWDYIFTVAYPNAKAFLGLIMNAEYREKCLPHRTAAVEDSRLIRLQAPRSKL